jgi:hypothetical protein
MDVRPIMEARMRETTLSLPLLSLLAGTRVMLGGGLALLLGDRVPARQRRAAGWALFLAGAASTAPLALEIMRRSRKNFLPGQEGPSTVAF